MPKTTEIEQGEEGNTILRMVIYFSMSNLQLWTFPIIRNWLKVVEKGVSLSIKIKKHISPATCKLIHTSYSLPASRA